MTITVSPFTAEISSQGSQGMPEGAHQASLYEAAQSIRAYTVNIIPGFLQAREYAAAVQRGWAQLLHPEASARDLNDLTVKGTSRILSLETAALAEGKSVDVILEAAALRSGFAGEGVMRAQLAKIAVITESLPGVRVRVIPEGIRTGIASPSGFEIIDDAGVYVEVPHAELHVTDPGEVAHFERLFSLLAVQSVPFGQYTGDRA